MSRPGFSIRKLINNPHRSPGSDDSNEVAFECSSAKSIRVQYELEQYQIQQIQKAARHQPRHQSSWVHSHSSSSSSSPKKTGPKKVPKPIAIDRHTDGGVRAQGASTGRRNSTPHAKSSSSSLAGRISPAAPLSARILGAVSCPFCAGGRGQQQHHHHHHHCQHLDVSHTAGSVLTPSQSPRLAATLPSDWVSPVSTPSSAPLTKKAPSQDASMWLPSPGLRSGSRGLRSSQTAAVIHTQNVPVKTPTITRTFADATTIGPPSGSEFGMNGPSPHHSTFVNGVPSPPLDPQDIHSGPMVGSNGDLREVPSDSNLSSATEGTWFLTEPEGGEGGVTDSVQQLIRQTDEAFKAVNSALDEAKRVSRSPTPPTEPKNASENLQQAPKPLHTVQAPQMPPLRTFPVASSQEAVPAASQNQLMSPMSPTSGAGRGTVLSPRKGLKSPFPLSPSPQIPRTPTRGSSIHKPKRGSKSPTVRTQRAASYDSSPSSRKVAATGSPPLKGGSMHRHQHSYHRSLSRLNLAADKVTDRLFEGRAGRFGFHKIEADEVITPDQVQEFRKTRLAKAEAEAKAEEARAEAKRQVSSETLRSRSASTSTQCSSEATDADTTLVEPSYAQNQPSRMGNPGTNASAVSPAADLSTPRASEFNRNVMNQASASSTSDETIRTGQNLLATPPPTPPQLPLTTFPSTFAPRGANTGDDETTTHPSSVVGPTTRSSRRPSHSRANSSLSHLPLLPTIPEVRITAPEASDSSSRQSQQEGQDNTTEEYEDQSATPKARTGAFFEDDGEHIFFASTPCTVTKPAFQHGRIRLAKADLVNAGTINSLESKLMTSPDETMDWIAFQMAILGGAGDLFSDPNDFLSRDAQEELADDLCDWFEDLGFSNSMLGSLVKREQPPAPRTLTSAAPLTPQTDSTGTPESVNLVFRERQASIDSRSSSPESKSSDEIPDNEVPETVQQQVHNLPIPLVSEHPSGYWNQQLPQQQGANGSSRPSRKTSSTSDRGLKRWTLEGHPKRYQGPGIDVLKANTLPLKKSGGQHLSPKPLPRTPKSGRLGSLRESMVSLPQSPMLDLVMTTAVDGSKEFVPMGYNLGHDLGDFLKWESEHVYASGFYGSD